MGVVGPRVGCLVGLAEILHTVVLEVGSGGEGHRELWVGATLEQRVGVPLHRQRIS